MNKRRYQAPILLSSSLDGGGPDSVIGQGTGQGTHGPAGMSWEEWLEEEAFGYEGPVGGAPNPDADLNGDGEINRDDYTWYLNHL